MRLGRASAYGLLALMTIAQRNGDSPGATAQQIAAATRVPVEYLRKVLQRLCHARLVRSERGRAGGFRLRRPIERITLLEVVEAIEGPIDDIAILDDVLLQTAPQPASQKLRRWRHGAAVKLRQLLKQTSLDDIFQSSSMR
jgi:Rrf2 family protein